MQRGGSWDNSDVKRTNRVSWSKTDKEYEAGKGPFQPAEEPRKPFFGLMP